MDCVEGKGCVVNPACVGWLIFRQDEQVAWEGFLVSDFSIAGRGRIAKIRPSRRDRFSILPFLSILSVFSIFDPVHPVLFSFLISTGWTDRRDGMGTGFYSRISEIVATVMVRRSWAERDRFSILSCPIHFAKNPISE